MASEVAITLDGAWSMKPWVADPSGPVTGQPTRLGTTFVVPDDLSGQPVELALVKVLVPGLALGLGLGSELALVKVLGLESELALVKVLVLGLALARVLE